jgi:hypothetical protein
MRGSIFVPQKGKIRAEEKIAAVEHGSRAE